MAIDRRAFLAGVAAKGRREARIEKIMGLNFLRQAETIWGA